MGLLFLVLFQSLVKTQGPVVGRIESVRMCVGLFLQYFILFLIIFIWASIGRLSGMYPACIRQLLLLPSL